MVCSSPERRQRFDELLGTGASDRAIADAIGVSRKAAQRHRQNHVLPQARAIANAAGKSRQAEEERKETYRGRREW